MRGEKKYEHNLHVSQSMSTHFLRSLDIISYSSSICTETFLDSRVCPPSAQNLLAVQNEHLKDYSERQFQHTFDAPVAILRTAVRQHNLCRLYLSHRRVRLIYFTILPETIRHKFRSRNFIMLHYEDPHQVNDLHHFIQSSHQPQVYISIDENIFLFIAFASLDQVWAR